jgi:tripeptide aminopeptidase
MINKKRLIRTFKQLVRIDSLSLREGKAANYVKKELRALGIRAFAAGKVRAGEVGNLAAYLPGRGFNSPVLMINAHLDTVSPGRNVRPVERGGHIFSDGKTILGADNKAGVAAILEILRTIKEKQLEHPPLRIIFTVAEEIGLNGAKVLPDKFLKADFGLAIDGGDIDEITTRAPTQYSLTATIIGRSAHAGLHPEEGINAIKVASEAIARMKLGRIDRETTANIGVIRGGQATNIVPDQVELQGEARSHNAKKLDRQVEHMERVLFKSCRKHRARLKLKVERTYKAFKIDERDKMILSILKVFSSSGLDPAIRSTGGGSDANIFNERGIPTIILGVGADHVHTTKENIRVDDLVKGTENILTIICEAPLWQNLKKKK